MLAVLFLARMNTKRRNSVKKQGLNKRKGSLDVTESVYCRTCMNTDNLMSIFYNSEEEEKIAEDLKLVSGLEIKVDDGFSQKMCSKCISTFNHALDFRRNCKRTENKLLEMLTSTKKKKYVVVKPKLKKTKIVKEELSCDDYGDDFQNDEEFDCKEDVKPIFVMKESKLPVRQKSMKIPNAPSYKCSTCNKEFRMKATYKAHMRFHTNYCVCESCGKRCRNNNQLQEHKRARHGLGRIHKCAYCEYSSATKEALVIHERRHTGERPYICDHCGATFHRRSNLVQHIAIHLPDKNFQCTFCPTREKSKKRLQIHISKAHRVKRYSYKCPRCDKLFQRNEHTHRHLSRVHHLPRDQHPHIERILLTCDTDYKPLPYIPCDNQYTAVVQ